MSTQKRRHWTAEEKLRIGRAPELANRPRCAMLVQHEAFP